MWKVQNAVKFDTLYLSHFSTFYIWCSTIYIPKLPFTFWTLSGVFGRLSIYSTACLYFQIPELIWMLLVALLHYFIQVWTWRCCHFNLCGCICIINHWNGYTHRSSRSHIWNLIIVSVFRWTWHPIEINTFRMHSLFRNILHQDFPTCGPRVVCGQRSHIHFHCIS